MSSFPCQSDLAQDQIDREEAMHEARVQEAESLFEEMLASEVEFLPIADEIVESYDVHSILERIRKTLVGHQTIDEKKRLADDLMRMLSEYSSNVIDDYQDEWGDLD